MSDEYTGHVPCAKCGQTHWMHGPCKARSELAGPSGSATWPVVFEFAKRMEAKLEKNRHKGDREGWLRDSAPALLDRLYEEVTELGDAICYEESLETIADEAADVANFAMMIADVCGELTVAHANQSD